MLNVTYQEKAFLQLVARRVVNHRIEAAKRGEAYNDLTPFSPLQCGIRARYSFVEIPLGGFRPVVQVRAPSSFSSAELLEIASEILDGPAKLRATASGDLEYVRESDAAALAP
jgi:hypothetical protein